MLTHFPQAALREERDQLQAEKAAWAISTPSGDSEAPVATTDEARLAWEAERAELIKARDQAAAHAKVCVYTTHHLYTGNLIMSHRRRGNMRRKRFKMPKAFVSKMFVPFLDS